jgi:phenylpropionate dioxygenase-like ring-hydroxylating dioxygenase large terminal subunit
MNPADFIYSNWYIVCTSRELKKKPIAKTILGIPLVLFRDKDSKPAALLDKCPHRNVPLSQGSARDNSLVCKYHGWQFDADGVCQDIPGLCSFNGDIKRNVVAYQAIEKNDFIWVYCQPNEIPKTQLYEFPLMDKPGFSTFSWQMEELVATFENIAENFLDATHTHFIHAGLIRSNNQRQEIMVKITRTAKMVEAVYLGEKTISGLIYQLLAPGCKEVISIGRFILPSIAQLEYRTDKEDYKLFISLFLTPVTENITKAYAVVTFRWGLPNWLGKVIAKPLFNQAARQDKAILELQAANIKRFAGENFVLTEIDVMKPHIAYLLKMANGTNIDNCAFEKIMTMKL